MKCLSRNKQTIYFANFSDKAKILEDGLFTGEYSNIYTPLESMKAVVSRSVGTSADEIFGNDITYNATLSVDDLACTIDENSIIWLDASTTEPNDYVVIEKAKSLNSIVYALRGVDYVQKGN